MVEPRLLIKSGTNTYPVFIDENLRFSAYRLITDNLNEPVSSYLIIADETVAGLYLDDVLNSFPESIKKEAVILPSGEQSKSFEQFERMITYALEKGLDRKSVIIALGGGVTGDLAGYTAASYMRGIRYVQMPTTLLAHDSSVGGKTGINHPLGKNLVGAFHPPAAVIYDSSVLYTLPEKEWRSGFAEVIKHGLIADMELYNWLETNITALNDLSPHIINDLLKRSIEIKAKIVQADEKEKGIRAFLNFGHTLAHSIEAEAGYGRMTHGEAVAAGMRFAMLLSEKIYENSLPVDRVCHYMTALGYDLSIPEECRSSELIRRMKIDKKSDSEAIRFVLLKEAALPELRAVEEETIYTLLEQERSPK